MASLTKILTVTIPCTIMVISKAKKRAAAKKAAITRAKNSKKNSKKQSKIAIKAYAAGKKAERRYAKNHLTQKIVLTGKGIPDIITFDKNKLVFYEVKPHLQRTGYTKDSRWRESHSKQRLLNKDQKRVFKGLLDKKIPVYMVYYYRQRRGTKSKPCYTFEYKTIKLQKRHFVKSKGPDPSTMSELKDEMDRLRN